MDELEKIDFKFEWSGKNYDKVAPNVIETAKKLLELNLIKLEPELSEDGKVVIKHTGVCKKTGLVDNLASGIVEENIYRTTLCIILKRLLIVSVKVEIHLRLIFAKCLLAQF